MRLVWNQDDIMLTWAASRIPHMHGRGFEEGARACGFVNEAKKTVGVVVFHDWQPEYRAMQISMAGGVDARWLMERGLWRELFEYAFQTCNVDKLWCLAAHTNQRSLRLQKAFGWTPEAVLQNQFGPGVHAVFSHIYREAYEAGKLYIKPLRESVP